VATPETIQMVRDLIPDIEEVDWEDNGSPSTLFTDAQITTYLFVNDENIKRAAAQACRALAVSEALISKVIKTEDLQTDGAKVANALLVAARDLEQSADRDDEREDGSAFDVIPYYPRPPQFWPR
jgi:hypothetical protein